MCIPTTASIYAFGAEIQVPMAPDIPSTDTGGSPPKSVLVCQTCGHESRSDGDWRERCRDTAGGPRIALVCPECEADITYRPLPEDSCHEQAIPVSR